MKFIHFILQLVYRFAPIKEEEFAKLQHEITEDWDSVIIDETHAGYKPGIKTTIKKFTQGPWARLCFGVLFIFSVRWIQDFMNPASDEIDEEDGKQAGKRFFN